MSKVVIFTYSFAIGHKCCTGIDKRSWATFSNFFLAPFWPPQFLWFRLLSGQSSAVCIITTMELLVAAVDSVSSSNTTILDLQYDSDTTDDEWIDNTSDFTRFSLYPRWACILLSDHRWSRRKIDKRISISRNTTAACAVINRYKQLQIGSPKSAHKKVDHEKFNPRNK